MAAAVRVAIIATVRHRFAGRPVAQVMSIAFTVFMIVPVLAPALEQAVMAAAGWRAIFWFVAAASALVGGWGGGAAARDNGGGNGADGANGRDRVEHAGLQLDHNLSDAGRGHRPDV